jgi:hypothetical protein
VKETEKLKMKNEAEAEDDKKFPDPDGDEIDDAWHLAIPKTPIQVLFEILSDFYTQAYRNVNWFSDGSELDPPVDNGRKTILIHEREVFDAMYRYFESSDTPIRGGEFIETLNYMEKNIFYLKDGNRVQIKIHGNHNNPMHQFDRSGQYLPIRRIQCLVFTDEHNERAVDPLLLSTPDLHNNWWIAQWSSGLKQYGEHEYRHLPPPEHWRASNGMEALHQMLQHFDPQMLQNFDPQMLQNFDPNGILHQFYANNPFGFN